MLLLHFGLSRMYIKVPAAKESSQDNNITAGKLNLIFDLKFLLKIYFIQF
jgi:hypothetical protein